MESGMLPWRDEFCTLQNCNTLLNCFKKFALETLMNSKSHSSYISNDLAFFFFHLKKKKLTLFHGNGYKPL